MQKIIAMLAIALLCACAKPVPFEETFRVALETAQPGDVVREPRPYGGKCGEAVYRH